MAKELIINADDYGISDDINAGIMDCYSKGIVTDISLLAVGDEFDHAVELAKKNGIKSIGTHLALTGGFKAMKNSSITDENGRFAYGFFWLFGKILFGVIKEKDIYDEFKAQVKRVKEQGFAVSHIDSHEHVHMFPRILKVLLSVAREENITYIRFPREHVNKKEFIKEPVNALRNMALSAACNISRRSLNDSDIKHNDHFIGHFHAHRLSEKDFMSFIPDIKDGLTELGCHPGYFGEHISKVRPWYKNCEKELQILCDNNTRDAIKKQSITLVSYGSLG